VFYVHKDSVRYGYKVYEKEIVNPDEVEVLGPAERENTMTLITCYPPGTVQKRLVVVAEQFSPDPNQNEEAVIEVTEPVEAELPSDAPSLWSRLWPF
jgi:LPXTG-site transpeptidase (sortase) family protein